MERHTMSKRELDHVMVIQHILSGELTQKEAASLMRLSVRQVGRKVKRYMQDGMQGLIHKNRGRPSNRKAPPSVVSKVLVLLKTVYSGFGPTLVAEKLAKHHAIQVSHDSVRRIMIQSGLMKSRKAKVLEHVWRERKHHFGEHVQVDGSYHKWFNNEYTTLIAFIDDATSHIELMFADHETTQSLAQAMQLYIKKHGCPRALYADRGRTYKVNNGKNKATHVTQFVRMINELDIQMINARSPQAKGRVERLFRTLQDRLTKELSLQSITTIDAANSFLQEHYIETINQKIRIPPKSELNLHTPLTGQDLNTIFCIKEYRKLNNDRTVSYKNRWFLLDKNQPVQLKKRSEITICISFDGTISLKKRSIRLNAREITKPIRHPKKPEAPKISNIYQKPAKNHPWRDPGLRDKNGTFLLR
jgi:transposase InsO family protein